jgi:hypothetical protein
MDQVKIFGERNTATNLLVKLIRANCAARVLPATAGDLGDPPGAHERGLRLLTGIPVFGQRLREARIDRIFAAETDLNAWKHAATRFERPEAFRGALVAICVRDPASWLTALHRKPYQSRAAVPADLDAFIDMPWTTRSRERLDGATFTPMELYNAKLRSYLTFMDGLAGAGIPCVAVPFERLVTDQLGALALLADHLDGMSTALTRIEGSTKIDPDKDWRWYRDYYAERRWADAIPAATMARIVERVDWDVAGRFGYAAP